MSTTKRDKCEIPEQVKTTVGRLMVVVASEAEPAKKIHYTSALISVIRSALLIYIRYWKADTIDDKMWALIHSMMQYAAGDKDLVEVELRYKNLEDQFRKLEQDRVHVKEGNATYEEKSTLERSKYDTNDLLRDYYEIMKCRKNWQRANNVYFENANAWQQSNSMLADIFDCLMDIANKRGLITIPQNAVFSISELNDFGTFRAIEQERKA